MKITDIYLAGSAQVNCKVFKRCNCPGLGLKWLPSVADVWSFYTHGPHLDVGQTPLIGWLLRSSHGNYSVTGPHTGPHKCEVTDMRTINYLHTGYMAESINTLFVLSRGRENGLNKVDPYRKQVQYINLGE